MRVLVVSQYFWPESFRINEITKSLIQEGIDVDVLTGKPNYPDGKFFPGYSGWGLKKEVYSGVTIFRVPLVSRGEKNKIRLAINYVSFIFTGALYGPWLLRKRKYDVIFVFGLSPILQAFPAIFLGWLKRSPVIIWIQDLWPESVEAVGNIRSAVILNVIEKAVRFIYKKSSLLLVQSKAFIEPVSKLSPDTPVNYYPNSVEEVFCRPTNVGLPKITELEAGFPVLFTGNLGMAQGVEVIIDAAEILKGHADIRFVILGQGSCWGWMKDEVKNRGLSNVALPGRFPFETMPGLMQKASVLLVTLTNNKIFTQTVPSKVQAYMAAGKPIIASLNGEGARVVSEAKCGVACPAEDSEALAKSILNLYEMPKDQREKLGNNARSYFRENFEHNRLMAQLIMHLKSESSKGN